jgi:hypothetical protein
LFDNFHAKSIQEERRKIKGRIAAGNTASTLSAPDPLLLIAD